MYTVDELFAGIGGFRLGFERTEKFKAIWANERDKYACEIYRKNFGTKELCEQDITKVSTDDIPTSDILCGGFPCQPHSLAGKREGFQDERGEVFYEIVRIAKAKRPTILLLENVKGLLSSEQGKAFGTILEELGNIGYWCEWQVLNSKHYGVPQTRQRVFIVGHNRERCTRQIFPIRTNDSDVIQQESENSKRSQVAWALRSRDYKDATNFVYWKNSSSGWVKEARTESPVLKAQSVLCRQPLILQEHSFSGENGRGRGFRSYEGVVPTLAGQMGTGGNNVPLVVADRSRSYAGLGRNLESPKPICNTLSGVQKDNLLLNPGERPRRLTPVECERLQGFPDNWTDCVANCHRYETLGNAVTVNVIQFLAERIAEAMEMKP
jgi:DNA (cytosine-5)-methyltransferase 1